MIPKYLHVMWTAVAPALGDHLWQSTLFAVVAGLLTLFLRRNHARARYWLWLAASLKFLIPFSLLVGIGAHLAWSPGPAGTNAGLYFAMEEVSQPFTQPTSSRGLPSIDSHSLVHLLPLILVALWLFGFVVVVSVWCLRWRQMTAAMREAVPLQEGREVEALRRVERMARMPSRIEMLLSSASLEPGIFGIARPVLVWPEGISEHLEDVHLEAILAHEVWHVRRRDNLAAAIHMVVEAIFWFHPLVWWLGARLVDERERACDEEVLELGSERQVYAESILKTCEFCVGSPLACVSGITGADLKKRIVRIMSERLAHRLSFGRKLLLLAMGSTAVAVPVVLGLVNRPPRILAQLLQTDSAAVQPFDVASIKPSRSGEDRVQLFMSPGKFTTRGQTVKEVIEFAYDIKSDNQLSGGPSWINSEKYDIEAKEEASVAEKLQKLPFEEHAKQVRLMVQALLADRFKLKVSHEMKDLPVYALVVAKGGSKLKPTEVSPPAADGTSEPKKQFRGVRMMGPGELSATNIDLSFLADILSGQPELGRLVVDQTGLMGNYDWTLKWTPEQSASMFKSADGSHAAADAPPPDSSGPSIFTALQEQLGLKLEPRKGPVETLVIDSVEKPSEN
jgi:bla regulator protein blaR1